MDKRIRATMILHELTQDKLAEIYKCDPSFVSLALRDKRKSQKALAIKYHVLGLMKKKAA